jgi:hypothetical protein
LLRDLLGILVVASAFFASFWSRFNTPNEQSIEPTHKQAHADNNRTETKPPLPLAVAIKSYPPPPVSTKEESRQNEETWLRRGNSLATLLTAIFAGGLLCVTYRYTKYTYNMWCEMQRQTTTAQKQFDASSRPWLSVDAIPSGDGLTYGSDGTLQIQLQFTIVNHGNSPAMDVMIMGPELGPVPEDKSATLDERVCPLDRPFNKSGTTSVGATIFPKTPYIQDMERPILPGQIIKTSPNLILPHAVGCVLYTNSYDRTVLHKTLFCYEVSKRPRTLILRNEHVLPQDLMLVRQQFGCNTAD